jgi:opacity protein-like surface antigen
MKSLWILFVGAGAAFSQPVSVGIRAGVPFTDFFNTVTSGTFSASAGNNRYIIGPTIELRLPKGFGIEFDALFRHFSYNTSANLVDIFTNSRTSGNAWEFPLLVKYRFGPPIVKPYLDAGVAFDTLSGLKDTITRTVFPGRNTTTSTTSNPDALNNNNTAGFVIGAGLDIHVLLHISPEVRYTRWGSTHFSLPNGSILSNQNQAEFLLGITF